MNQLYCTDANWSPTRWKSLIFVSGFLFDSFSFNIFDKLLHAHTCAHTAWNAAKQRFSTKIDFQIRAVHTHSASAGLCLLLALYLSHSHSDTHTWFCTRACIHTSTRSSFRSPSTHTRRVAGFADVCPDLLPAQALLMPVCWLWVFHSLLWNKSQRH